MYLQTAKAKGNAYIYLVAYEMSYKGLASRRTLYGFGRKDKAAKKMYSWKENFSTFPTELLELGCTQDDLNYWIQYVETGITKTGRKASGVI
ncbi:hypothetical protein ACFSO7_22365 [Bacillus sp. CGMCC 1.16607]|uniref:hypothetical protein n=1 Tax=Bacillus sp. CGMCC 1.16607 TaxID=3351842 RepID=UPI00363F3513